MKTKFLILLCAITIGMGNITVSRAANDDDIATITDVALVRPGCFLATILGSAVFIVALPIAAISGSVRRTADTLVLAPARPRLRGPWATLRPSNKRLFSGRGLSRPLRRGKCEIIRLALTTPLPCDILR